jgi:uncharacterized membrane protein
MTTPAQIAKHPIHPILVSFPIGLWVFSLASDLIALAQGDSSVWKDVALYTLIGGIAGALLAAVPGFVDWFSLATPRVRRLGTIHMALNLALVALYTVNAWLRLGSTSTDLVPVALSVLGVVLLGISGWLGGEMVYVHRVGVTPQTSESSSTRPRRAA